MHDHSVAWDEQKSSSSQLVCSATSTHRRLITSPGTGFLDLVARNVDLVCTTVGASSTSGVLLNLGVKICEWLQHDRQNCHETSRLLLKRSWLNLTGPKRRGAPKGYQPKACNRVYPSSLLPVLGRIGLFVGLRRIFVLNSPQQWLRPEVLYSIHGRLGHTRASSFCTVDVYQG